MRKIATLALVAFVALGLLYTGGMTQAHAAVKTRHGIIHKSVTHTKRETVVHRGAMAY